MKTKTCGEKYIDGSLCTKPEGHEADKEERHHEQCVADGSRDFVRVSWTSIHLPPIEAFTSNQRRLVSFLLGAKLSTLVPIAHEVMQYSSKMDKGYAISVILSALGRSPSKRQREARLAVWNALRAAGCPFIRPEHLGDDL